MAATRRPACTPDMWMQAASEEAARCRIKLPKLLGGSNAQLYAHARWRVWRGLAEDGCSYLSIGKSSGFNHASVIYGCNEFSRKRLLRRFQARRAEATA